MRALACFTMARYLRAFSTMTSGLPDFSASARTNSPPMPKADAPASINSAAVFRLTPPVGTSGTCGSGPFRALMYLAPPTSPQGKILTKSDPALQAVITSVGVRAPAIISTPSRTANATIGILTPGLTRNWAPALRQRRAVSTSSTVPAPMSTSEALLLLSSRITSTAPGTVIVISTIGIPPWQTASDAINASREDDARTTGTTPISAIRSRTFCLFISPAVCSWSTRDARPDAFHYLDDFLKGGHIGISRRSHGECAVGGAAFDSPLRVLAA